MKFSETSIGKAEKLIADSKLDEDEKYPGLIWWAESSNGEKRYRIQPVFNSDGTLIYVSCTCPFGMHTSPMNTESMCYHAIAVLIREAERT